MSEKKSCFVATIDLALADKLREDLIDQGFEMSRPQYTLFSAQKKRDFLHSFYLRQTHRSGQRDGRFYHLLSGT